MLYPSMQHTMRLLLLRLLVQFWFAKSDLNKVSISIAIAFTRWNVLEYWVRMFMFRLNLVQVQHHSSKGAEYIRHSLSVLKWTLKLWVQLFSRRSSSSKPCPEFQTTLSLCYHRLLTQGCQVQKIKKEFYSNFFLAVTN